jgi:hypothetical protein
MSTLATVIEPGRVVRIGKGEVTYEVERANDDGTFDIVSINSKILGRLHKTIPGERLSITKHDRANWIDDEITPGDSVVIGGGNVVWFVQRVTEARAHLVRYASGGYRGRAVHLPAPTHLLTKVA